jgi:arginine decarboxylase-like protein
MPLAQSGVTRYMLEDVTERTVTYVVKQCRQQNHSRPCLIVLAGPALSDHPYKLAGGVVNTNSMRKTAVGCSWKHQVRES